MVIWTHYVQRSRSALGPTLYSARILRHLYRSRASYAFWRSKNTSKRIASPMAVRCWSNLTLRAALPVPRPAQNPCSMSWSVMDVVRRRFRRLQKAFQRTSNRPPPRKSPLSPLGIRKTVCHVLLSASTPEGISYHPPSINE